MSLNAGVRKKRRRIIAIVVAIVVAVAVLMGYQFSTNSGVFADEQPPTQSIPANKPQPIGKDDTGANVTASGTAVPRALKAEPAKNAIAPPFQNYKAPNHKWHITSITPSGKLPAPVQVTLPLDHKATDNDLVLVAVNHSHTADGWTYQSGTLTADKQHITFTVTELSWFTPFWTDLTNMVNELKEQFFDGMTSNVFAEAKKPECQNEDKALKDSYRISSDWKDTIFWCFGIEGGQRVLKVVNHRKYPLVIKTSNMTIKDRGHADLDLSQFVNGGNDVMLNGGDQAIFVVNKLDYDTMARLNTDISKVSLGLHALDVLVSVLAQVILKVNPHAMGKASEFMEFFFDSKECVGALGDITNMGNFFAKCFTWDILKEAFNWQVALAAPVMTAFSVINLGQATASAIADSGNGKSKYQVTITRPKPNPFRAYIGDDWGRHESELHIKSDGTGFMSISSGGGGIPGCGSGIGFCYFNGNFRSTVNSDGSLNATFTKVWATLDSKDNIVPMPPDYVENMPGVGDSITIKSFFDGTLLIQQHGDLAKNDMDIDVHGGHYRGYVWCGPNSSNDPTAPNGSLTGSYCGA